MNTISISLGAVTGEARDLTEMSCKTCNKTRVLFYFRIWVRDITVLYLPSLKKESAILLLMLIST